MNLEIARWLVSEEGLEAVNRASQFEEPLPALETLRRKVTLEQASSAWKQVELRKKARTKFSRADQMVFTPPALEMATSEQIADYCAERFRPYPYVVEGTCGIGGNTIGLARVTEVLAGDKDFPLLLLARHNLTVYGLREKVAFVCADASSPWAKCPALFLDPARRVEGHRVWFPLDFQPPLSAVERWLTLTPAIGVKLSPALDPEGIPYEGEWEYLSEGGECKEALLWLGELATCKRRATILPERVTLTDEPVPPPEITSVLRYLYEPDPAVRRAHLVWQLAHRISAGQIHPEIAYLTSDQLVKTPFAQGFEVLTTLPFNLKRIKQAIKAFGITSLVIKKRGVPYQPEEIRRHLKLPEGPEGILLLTRTQEGPLAILAKYPE
jgi:hypothetical protein